MSEDKRFVLLVDDEQNILNALSRELDDWVASHELELLTAISAQKGLEVLDSRGEGAVIVVSDLRMPEMKGSDFLLRVHDSYPDVMTILLTGYTETEEVQKAVKAGIFSYLLKPWDGEYLVAEMEKAYEHGELLRQNARYLKIMVEELKWAGEMQKAMLGPNLPNPSGVEFRVSYRPVPSLYCGGDYYDVISLAPSRYLLLIGDVAGHGVRAALITSILKAVIFPEYVRATIGKDFSPGAFLCWLNSRMNFELRAASGIIITFFAGVLDVEAGFFKYANAGQNHPFLLRSNEVIELPVSGPGLGFASSVSYAEQSLLIRCGDVITLYTDGLVELGGAAGGQSIKSAELFRHVEYSTEYHHRLFAAAMASAKSNDFDDDVTLLTARIA
jgi:sigma-B regulation protein RsbU (phosphoserine phosphatase)